MGRSWIQSDRPCRESYLSFKASPLPKNTQPPSTQNLSCMGGRLSTLDRELVIQINGPPSRNRTHETDFSAIYHRALEDQPALQGLKDAYLAFNISQSHQPHSKVTTTTTSIHTPMVPASLSPLRTEGETTGTAVGKSRKYTKSLTGLELLLPPV